MQVIFASIRRRLSDESGMTMVVVMGVLLVATLFSVAAISAADGDIGQTRTDVDRKQAYAAAEAGINDYMSRLNQDSNYWTNCTNVPAPAPVNQRFVRTGAAQADPRKWRKLPNSTEADYTIELIPANGKAACDPNDPAGTMIDSSTGAFTIRATGRSSAQGTGTPVYRSITAKFRRKGFLDFLWFTDFETTDPEFFRGTAQYADAQAQCVTYERNGRPSGYPCSDITFVEPDGIRGPLHTNDRLLVSGSPVFGRNSNDEIETVSKDGKPHPDGPAWEPNGSGTPNFVGKLVSGAPKMEMPPTNAQLTQLAGWVFTGDTRMEFRDNSVNITTYDPTTAAPIHETRSLTDPTFNGVVYVKGGTCNSPSTRQNPYPAGNSGGDPVKNVSNVGCPNLWVSGSYSRSMTLASAGDVIVEADEDWGTGPNGKGLRRNGDAIMGLIADNFVRVYHPCTSAGVNITPGTEFNIQIDAAILSLQHSFTVDEYDCGARQGTLTVNGAIAQKFRGPVGQFGSTPHGYTKNYNYDDRLLYRSPPFFLDPVQSAWRTVSFTEESKATK